MERLTARLFAEYGGWSATDVREALSTALGRDFREDITDGGDNGTPLFRFAVLANLQKLLCVADERTYSMVWFNWLPE